MGRLTRAFQATVALTLLLLALWPATLMAEGVASPAEAALQPMEARLLDLLNGERMGQGLSPLQLDPSLLALARDRSNDMAARGYFNHVTPEGVMVFDMMNWRGIPFRLAGENLALNGAAPGDSPDIAHQGLMWSPTHAQNILDPGFNKVGIGVATNGAAVYFTQLFAILD